MNKLQLNLNIVFGNIRKNEDEVVKVLNYNPLIHFNYLVPYYSHNKHNLEYEVRVFMNKQLGNMILVDIK